jgi:tRNA/rRNA methyltransferase
MLQCADGSYYVGHTDNLEQRVAQHQQGQIPGYTSSRRPISLIWSEAFSTREEALAAERQIRGWSRAKKEALIAGDWPALSIAAQPPSERSARASATLGDVPRLRSGRTEGVKASKTPFVPREVEGSPAPAERSRGQAALPPAIILVRPQLGQNIGKAARAMLNFGLTELRLVAPRDGWPNPEAGPAASGADEVLDRAQVFATVGEAVADCAYVYATTVRRRGVTKPVVTPAEAAAEMRAAEGRTAILFGPERSGLETDDVAVARSILTVPINPDFGSLNLAQAVILVAYEWSRAEALAQPSIVPIDPPAPQAELDGMIAQLDGMLEAAGFFFPPDRVPTTKRMLRTLLTKPAWSSQEVRTLRGVLSALDKPRSRG